MRVLVVEDDASLRETLAGALRREGYPVAVAADGDAALVALAEQDVDLVLLDRDLPGLSGDAVCRAMTAMGHPARVLMLTASGSLSDRVEGLDLGADDYLPKPFAYAELLARMRALTRRTPTVRTAPVVTIADLSIDTVRRLAERAGRPLRLTTKEFAVLERLALADGGPVAVEELLEDVWEDPYDRTRGVVKVLVYSLRRKLGEPALVHYDSGRGYRLSEHG